MHKPRIALAALALALLAACSSQGPGDSASTGKDQGGQGNQAVGLALSTQNNPFFVALKKGAEDAAREAGVQLIVVDAQDDSAKQIANVEDLIQKHVGALLLNPTDSAALVGAVGEANRAGIPVITLDRAVDGGKVLSHIASDNRAGGATAARFLKTALADHGNVIELEGVPGTSAARERGEGFETELANSSLKLIARQPANFDRAQAMSVTENLLQAHPDVQGLFAQNDEMALGALRALDGAGKHDVVVVGFDGTPDALAAIKEGKLAATVAQQPELMGQLGVQTAAKALHGQPVDAKVVVPLKLVTREAAH